MVCRDCPPPALSPRCVARGAAGRATSPACGGGKATACDAAARTSQRVSAALGSASASRRRRKAVTSLCAAVSTSLRLAERSRIRGDPGISMTSAPSAAQDSASKPARRTAVTSGACSRRKRPGSSPSSTSPVAEISPCSSAAKSGRSQRIRLPSAARTARAVANPAAAASSPATAGKTSCSAPLRSPPYRQASAWACPNATRACACESSSPARMIALRKDMIFSAAPIAYYHARWLANRGSAVSQMRRRQIAESGQILQSAR